MNVVYSSSDSYAPIAGVSMFSLLVNNKNAETIRLFVIDNNISNENKYKMQLMCDSFGRSIQFIPIQRMQDIIGTNVNIGRWNISTFARLFEASLLPKTIDKVIHIDCDTLVIDSLDKLWETDLDECIVAGAYDRIGDGFKKELGLSLEDTYINAGNIVLNLEEIRKQKIEKIFKDYILTHPQLSFVDQAVINACVPNNKKKLLPLRYNVYSLVYYVNYRNLNRVKKCKLYYSEEEVSEALNNPCIVHFTTCFMDGTRPWIENNKHPLIDTYNYYKSLSPWSNEPLWDDNRGLFKKIIYKTIQILPQRVSTSIVGVVHNYFLPARNKLMRKTQAL